MENGTAGVKARKKRVHKSEQISSNNSGTKNALFNQASHLKNTQLNEMRKRRRNFLNRINCFNTITVIFLPLIAISLLVKNSIPIIPQNPKTFLFSCFYFNFISIMFNTGYHKLFSHRSIRPRFYFFACFLAIFGSGMGLGSIRWWAGLHRAHHQFTNDTEKNPYSIKRGFLWAHFGWLVMKPKNNSFYAKFIEHEFPSDFRKNDDAQFKNIETSLLENNLSDDELDNITSLRIENEKKMLKLIIWQEKYYIPLFLIVSLAIPILVSFYICNDTVLNGFLYPGALSIFIAQQLSLNSNSLCHLKWFKLVIGTQPFNDSTSAQDCINPMVDLLTYGQSKQNYHHEFPHDYRSSSSYFAFDPTKWFIYSCYFIGIIQDICTTPNDLITQLQIQQQQKLINRAKSQLNWGTPISKLPLIKPKEFKKIISSAAHNGKVYIVIQNIIHDATPFINQHPGGSHLLKASHAQDATKAFYGGVYGHSTAAINLLATMRIGVLDVGNKEEVWKRVASEESNINNSGSVSEQNRSGKPFSTAEAA